MDRQPFLQHVGQLWRLKRTEGTAGYYAALLIVSAAALRIALIAQGWPLLDSDEGTMGLMAMHIQRLSDFPLFFYGQGYMGATEAYLAAFFFQLFGVSSFSLRLGLVLMFVVFLIAMYLLVSQVYSLRFALVVLALLALGSNAVLTRELAAVGGSPETLMAGAIMMCLAAWLALPATSQTTQHHSRRLLAYGGWGLAAGFGLFSHVLVAPFALLSAPILLLFCWRDLRSLAPFCLLAGFFIGISPIIAYNVQALTSPGEKSTLFYIFHAIDAGGIKTDLLHQLKGALLISLPTATGANPLCGVAEVRAWNVGSLHTLRCTLVHTGWSLGVLLLWGLALLLAVSTLWQLWRGGRGLRSWSDDERQLAVRQCVQLALLLAAAITLVLYILSPNSALYPVATSRYLIGLLIATPAVLWPLWQGTGQGTSSQKTVTIKPLARLVISLQPELMRRALLLPVGLVLLLGIFSTFSGIPPEAPATAGENIYFTQTSTQHLAVPATQALNRQESALIQHLLHIGANHIYSDYWTCDRLIFQSQERIICSAVNETLGAGHDRYLPYRTIVRADHRAAYVFQVGSAQDVVLTQHITTGTGTQWKQYRRAVFAGYAIYQKVI
ncbi:MAG: glycosyltransferase family 39 protein [Ktedonobacteraceae bacterium]|nr:glycosyltransferase family 39 protein [Ktedonobacteraceae bacterium]